MTPNEQLIAHMQEWIDGKEAFLPDNIGVCIRALLEENKHWKQCFLDANADWARTGNELGDERTKSEKLESQFQQTREELERAHEASRIQSSAFMKLEDRHRSLRTVLEQVKAELEVKESEYQSVVKRYGDMAREFQKQHTELENARSQLSAKDKVLEWYAKESNHDLIDIEINDFETETTSEVWQDSGFKARSIISKYEVKT